MNPCIFHYKVHRSARSAHTLVNRIEVAISAATFKIVIYITLENVQDYHLFINNRYFALNNVRIFALFGYKISGWKNEV